MSKFTAIGRWHHPQRWFCWIACVLIFLFHFLDHCFLVLFSCKFNLEEKLWSHSPYLKSISPLVSGTFTQSLVFPFFIKLLILDLVLILWDHLWNHPPYLRNIFRKTNISPPLSLRQRCAYQGVRYNSFSEHFPYVLMEWSLFG